MHALVTAGSVCNAGVFQVMASEWDVTQATLVAQLMLYASPFWRGFINAEETNRLQSILNRAIRLSYFPHDFKSLDELLDSADYALFHQISRNPMHVLNQLLPPRKRTAYNLRKLHVFIHILFYVCLCVIVLSLRSDSDYNKEATYLLTYLYNKTTHKLMPFAAAT